MAKLPEPLARLMEGRGTGVWLVGGAVRDLLLGRPVSDWDVVAEDAAGVGEGIERFTGRKGVQLHAEPLTLRFATPHGELDVVQWTGGSLRADLQRRDFTVNAMALALGGSDGMELVDPLGGMVDLRAGLIRATAAERLREDPVRVVRAYRMAAELGFRIAPGTRLAAGECSGLLASAAAQRWGNELLKLLDARLEAAAALRWMLEDGVLARVLPQVEQMKGIGRGGYHHLDVLGHTFEALVHADALMRSPRRALPTTGEKVGEYLRLPNARAMVRAAVLLHDVGKPATYKRTAEGRVTFYDHDDVGARIAWELLGAWAWPRRVRQAVVKLVDIHMRPLQLARALMEEGAPITDRALRHLMRDAGEHLPALFLLAAADLKAARGPESTPTEDRALLNILDDMLGRALAIGHEVQRQRLVNGHDLMRHLGLEPGPELGAVLRAVHEAEENGQVRTREDALRLARRLVEERGGAGV